MNPDPAVTADGVKIERRLCRMPSRIVLNSWGSLGDLFPYLAVGRALKARGHTAVLAVPAFYRSLVAAAGLEHADVGPEVDPSDRALIAGVMDPMKGPEFLIRTVLMPALRVAHEQMRAAAAGADLIVTHPVAFAGPIVASEMRLPWVSTVLAPASMYSRVDAPVMLPFSVAFALRRMGAWTMRPILAIGRKATAEWLKPVHALRDELGLPAIGNPLFEGQRSPHLNLALFSRVLGEPQRDWAPHTEITGFPFYNEAAPLSHEVEAFLDAGPAPVVFTLGSSAVWIPGSFYIESVQAVEQLGIRAVMLVGPMAQNRPEVDPQRVLLIESAPHDRLFPRASCIVHQGGVGTTGQALRAGKPMLIVPHAHDQPDNAYRVQRLGISRTIFPGAYKAHRVARALAALLGKPAVQGRSAIVGATVRSERGAELAADLITSVSAASSS
jgi:UDP:flavonoid glycosyltransferase YjiC (YdhE family)